MPVAQQKIQLYPGQDLNAGPSGLKHNTMTTRLQQQALHNLFRFQNYHEVKMFVKDISN